MNDRLAQEPFLVDTNILVYAYDKSEPRKQKMALAFLEYAKDNESSCTALQNLCEFASVASGKNLEIRQILPAIVIDLKDMFHLVHYDAGTLERALQLIRKKEAPFWDALLAETMKENGIRTIVTENENDFEKIPWISVFNPFKGDFSISK